MGRLLRSNYSIISGPLGRNAREEYLMLVRGRWKQNRKAAQQSFPKKAYMWFQAYSGYEWINKLGWNCKKYKCQNANYLITSQLNSNFKNANSYLRLGFCKISSTVTLTKAFLWSGYLRVCLFRSVKTPKTSHTSITGRRRRHFQSFLAHLRSKLCQYPLTKLPKELSLTIFLLVKTLNIM